jgi:hypothetical protein
MTEYGTIKIPRDEYEKHNEKRQAAGLTWAEYLNEEAARPGPDADLCEEVRELRKEVRNASAGEAEVDTEALGKAVADELDAVRDPASMAADPSVDGAAVAEEIANRLDDLEARLPRKVAEEVLQQR